MKRRSFIKNISLAGIGLSGLNTISGNNTRFDTYISNRPPINKPKSVPIPQYALSKVVCEIGRLNTSAPKLSKIGSCRNKPNV